MNTPSAPGHVAVNTHLTNSTPTAERLLYSRAEAARQLSVSVRSLDYLISSKQLMTRRIGRKVLIPRSELLRFARGNHTDDIRPAYLN